jgi:hypothetical protein
LETIEREIFAPESRFTTTFRYPSDRMRDVGLLRIAYLEMYCALGYGCLFHDGIEGMGGVLAQLNRPDEYVFPTQLVSDGAEIPDRFLGTNIVYDPFPLRSFLVVFDVNYKGYKRRYGLFLPGARLDWQKTYDILEKAKGSNLRFSITPCSQWSPKYQENPWITQEMWDLVFSE